ncbi:AfsR/SARP family transcriptional regulator [Kribbella italica]|uniref:DNA-binding SARP family transcriptional activator n=1 Tax=Kribbella italica TaxID=1540520 RepID=A0A7W9JE32_9ACTN|nr:AfsR/SARP family transcriptional regulator [Kribbella italica]MBB5840087.1 DNA-binding SARP family transcriptional activator [Kribbella italica]
MNGHSAHTPARIAFRVLGPLEVDGPDGAPLDVSGGKPATMLTLLLLHRNAWVSTDQLIDAVWAGLDAPASAQRNLKTYVWQLRRALPDERIESRPGAYRVRVLPGELDADVAADLSDQARIAPATKAVSLLEQALGLWRGCPYDGLTGDATSAVDRLTELHRSLREDLADASLTLGRSTEAISLLKALTDEDPLRELAWTRLMTALHRTGRRHEALAAYRRARTVLVRDLGIEPGAELTRLHQQILTDQEQMPAASSAPVPSDLPVRISGFVGREQELAAVRAAVSPDRVCVISVDGMAGIGKSAFVLEAAAALQDVDAQIWGTEHPRVLGRRVLLVLENVEDSNQVRDLMPNTPGSVVLVTSRRRLTGLDRDLTITLEPLADNDAVRITDCEQALRWSAGHPEALRRFAELLEGRPAWTAARLANGLDRLPARQRALAGLHDRFDETYHSLAEPVRRLYRLLSLTPQFDVRRAGRLLGADQQEVEPMIDELIDQHLVSEPAPGRFGVHPVVRDHAHRLLLATESPDDLLAAAQRARLTGQAELELVSPDDPRVA